jgi:hypothetical protein
MDAKFLGSLLDTLLGGHGNGARQRSLVEEEGNRGRGKTALLRHIADRSD